MAPGSLLTLSYSQGHKGTDSSHSESLMTGPGKWTTAGDAGSIPGQGTKIPLMLCGAAKDYQLSRKQTENPPVTFSISLIAHVHT